MQTAEILKINRHEVKIYTFPPYVSHFHSTVHAQPGRIQGVLNGRNKHYRQHCLSWGNSEFVHCCPYPLQLRTMSYADGKMEGQIPPYFLFCNLIGRLDSEKVEQIRV